MKLRLWAEISLLEFADHLNNKWHINIYKPYKHNICFNIYTEDMSFDWIMYPEYLKNYACGPRLEISNLYLENNKYKNLFEFVSARELVRKEFKNFLISRQDDFLELFE